MVWGCGMWPQGGCTMGALYAQGGVGVPYAMLHPQISLDIMVESLFNVGIELTLHGRL